MPAPRTPQPADTDREDGLARLRREQGIDFMLTRRVGCALAGGASEIAEIVRLTRAPRRWVQHVVVVLGVSVDERTGELRVAERLRGKLLERLDCHSLEPQDVPVNCAPHELRDVLDEISSLRPPSLWSLDHVPATTDTIVRRALHMKTAYELSGSHVVCIGDHDLTSLAIALTSPTASVTVVDIDERLLEYIDEIAERRALRVRCLFADARIEIPPSLLGRADLAFADPPYTPDGIELFVARAVACLRQDAPAAILLCYDANDAQLARVLEVQERLGRMRLAVRGMLPAFNRYVGAEAIGAASALWTLRPTRKSWRVVERGRDRRSSIYTRGSHAEEAAPKPLDASVVSAAVGEALFHSRVVVVLGDPMDKATFGGAAETTTLARLVEQLPPAGRKRPFSADTTVIASLFPAYGEYFLRLLLRDPRAGRIVAIAARRDVLRSGFGGGGDPIARFIGAAYRVHVRNTPAHGIVLAVADRVEGAGGGWQTVARHILDRPAGKVLNSWREGLVALSGGKLSKNEARALIRETGLWATLADRYAAELPIHTLRRLSKGVCSTAARIAEDGATFGEPPCQDLPKTGG